MFFRIFSKKVQKSSLFVSVFLFLSFVLCAHFISLQNGQAKTAPSGAAVFYLSL